MFSVCFSRAIVHSSEFGYLLRETDHMGGLLCFLYSCGSQAREEPGTANLIPLTFPCMNIPSQLHHNVCTCRYFFFVLPGILKAYPSFPASLDLNITFSGKPTLTTISYPPPHYFITSFLFFPFFLPPFLFDRTHLHTCYVLGLFVLL